ncbi:MAG: EAL domain-containing protein [Oxalobacteraceae bacterium]|nr:MAG: EAL domain-containing protein [Oxalobacteraceae bacterium]
MPDITYGRLQTADGRLLTETGSGVRLTSDAALHRDTDRLSVWSVINTGSVQISAPVVRQGERVGTITLLSRTPELKTRLLSTVWTTLLGALVALAAGLLVAVNLARRISQPVTSLATVVRRIDATHDYSVRAEIAADGEVAELVAGINTMLTGIQERDAKIAAQVEGLEDEVAARTAELSVAKSAAENANAAKSDFLAVMSHEIRTPLNGILALSDLLARSELPARQARHAQVIAKSGRSLLNIINDILDFSKVEAGKMELEVVEFQLADVAEDVASLFASKAAEQGLDLACFIDPRLPRAHGDPTRLRQVIGNLVNNAIKFTETGGVLINLTPDPLKPQAVLVSVQDTGPGIPADRLPTLFEAFTQADQTTTRRFGGTGLGLAICDRLVRAMEGEWRLNSVLGEGSTFAFTAPLLRYDLEVESPVSPRRALALGDVGPMTTVALQRYFQAWRVPLTDDAEAPQIGGLSDPEADQSIMLCQTDAEAMAMSSAKRPAFVKPIRRADLRQIIEDLSEGRTPALASPHHNHGVDLRYPTARVLVVDDSDVNREVACEALARLGVIPETASDGLEAIEAISRRRFDLVLMDGSMPNLDGFEASRRIRAKELAEDQERTVIVALTAHVVGSGATAWKDADMDGVIHKPFTMDDLAAVLGRFCSEKSEIASDEPVVQSHLEKDSQSDDVFDPTIRAELKTMAKAGRADFVERIQQLYRDNAPLRLKEAEAAQASGDRDALARAAHALKSMSLSMGARAVSAEASRLEVGARSDTALRDLPVDELRTALARTLDAMGFSSDPSRSWRERLDHAIHAGHLHLVYQPLVDRSDAFSGKVEALIRWHDPVEGALSPADFIPALEQNGCIARLTDFVIQKATQELADRPEIKVAVNSSALEFRHDDIAARVSRHLTTSGFSPSRLEIEVTETAMMNVCEAARTIDALKALGVGVGLDDFGAGNTSLHALRDLRFTTLKIDRSFVDDCCTDTASAAIIHAVIGVGRALGMQVVCEGVETAAQAQFLRIAGAHLRQGYFHYHPCKASELPGLDPAMVA